MNNHPVFGVTVPEKGWVPCPRYLMRRHRLLHILRTFPRGKVLEAGCGSGALLKDLSRMGFSCTAYDTSVSAYEMAKYINRGDSNVTILDRARSHWNSAFDYLLAFEILEHIEDDEGTLKKWFSWVKPGGYILLSVPAHPSHWNATDVWAGHVRRYDRERLQSLFDRAGFSILKIESYGFPLANVIEPIRAWQHARLLKRERALRVASQSRERHNDRSGVERSLETRLYPLQASWFGTRVMQVFCTVQGWFANTDLGNGYLVLAERG